MFKDRVHICTRRGIFVSSSTPTTAHAGWQLKRRLKENYANVSFRSNPDNSVLFIRFSAIAIIASYNGIESN